MRDGIEKCFLQFLRLTRHLRGPALFQGAFLVHKKRELGGEGVEQFALLKRGRTIEPHGEHTFGAVAGDERNVQRVGIGKRVGRSSRALFFLKRPGRDAFIFARRRENARRMTGKAAFVAQPNGGIGLERFFDQRQNFRQRFIKIASWRRARG